MVIESMVIHPILGILTQWLLKKPVLKIWDPPWQRIFIPWFLRRLQHPDFGRFFDLPRAPAFQVTQIGLLANESG